MGWVWRAQQVDWQAPVAIKLIDPGMLRASAGRAGVLAPSPVFQRFLSEARAAAAIRSPHVVQVLDHGVDPGLQVPFIVMELLEGETLEGRIEREGRLDVKTTAEVLSHVARALNRMHENQIVHRDLKPSNVFLVRNDEEIVAKVLDFGIAKNQTLEPGQTPITATGQQMGTPFYMSPEQIRGSKDVDFRADLWAFAVIAFECLTGRRPFDGETLGDLTLKICVEPLPVPSLFATVPEGFDAWFLRCVTRERAATFASVREATELLRAVLLPGVRISSFELADGRERAARSFASTFWVVIALLAVGIVVATLGPRIGRENSTATAGVESIGAQGLPSAAVGATSVPLTSERLSESTAFDEGSDERGAALETQSASDDTKQAPTRRNGKNRRVSRTVDEKAPTAPERPPVDALIEDRL